MSILSKKSGVISLGFIVMLVILVTTIVIAVLVIKQRRHCFHSKLYSLDLLGLPFYIKISKVLPVYFKKK